MLDIHQERQVLSEVERPQNVQIVSFRVDLQKFDVRDPSLVGHRREGVCLHFDCLDVWGQNTAHAGE